MINFTEFYEKILWDFPQKGINQIEIDDLDESTGLYLNDTSIKHPVSFSGVISSCIHINREFFKKNKNEVQKKVLNMINNTEEDSFYLSNNELINQEVIFALISNKHIKNITLDGNIFLNKQTIQHILSSHICHLNCNVDFDNDPELLYQYIPGLDIINYPEVAGTSVLEFGNQNVELFLYRLLTKKELTQLKILFTLYPQEKTYINLKYKKQLDELISVINSDKIIIRRFVPYTKEEYVYLNSKYDNVFFNVASNSVTSIKSLIMREEIMDNIINEVNSFALSPLEKYMYLYNIVKMYKEYKEIEDKQNPQLSRYSEYTLFNDYMVCVGYATLLEELVDRLKDKNVICTTYGCNILENDQSYGHCRCLTKIKDEKYSIDGIYISDPTWDCISYYKKEKRKNGKHKINYNVPTADKDLYNHFLLTKEEIDDESISYASKDISDVLFGSNFSVDSITGYGIITLETDVINKKFNTNILINKKNGKNIIKSTPISGDTLIKAITNLYSVIYSDKHNDIDSLVQNTVLDNISNQYKNFSETKNKFGVKIKTKIVH